MAFIMMILQIEVANLKYKTKMLLVIKPALTSGPVFYDIEEIGIND